MEITEMAVKDTIESMRSSIDSGNINDWINCDKSNFDKAIATKLINYLEVQAGNAYEWGFKISVDDLFLKKMLVDVVGIVIKEVSLSLSQVAVCIDEPSKKERNDSVLKNLRNIECSHRRIEILFTNCMVACKSPGNMVSVKLGKKGRGIIKQFGDKLVQKVNKNNDKLMSRKSNYDIAYHLEKAGGKYSPYMAKLYLNDEYGELEDAYQIMTLIDVFECSKRYFTNRKLITYSLAELISVVKPYMYLAVTKYINPAKEKELYENGSATNLISSKYLDIVIPHTKQAAVIFGKDMGLCTSVHHHEVDCFDHYNLKGYIYILRTERQRYQFHIETRQFKKNNNIDIDNNDLVYLQSFPEWSVFLRYLEKQHGEDFLNPK